MKTLTPRSRVLSEKLTGPQIVKKLPSIGNPKVHYLIYKDPPSVLVLSHAIPLPLLKGKGKSVSIQAWTGPDGSRKLRFQDFVTTAKDGGRLSALRTGRL